MYLQMNLYTSYYFPWSSAKRLSNPNFHPFCLIDNSSSSSSLLSFTLFELPGTWSDPGLWVPWRTPWGWAWLGGGLLWSRPRSSCWDRFRLGWGTVEGPALCAELHVPVWHQALRAWRWARGGCFSWAVAGAPSPLVPQCPLWRPRRGRSAVLGNGPATAGKGSPCERCHLDSLFACRQREHFRLVIFLNVDLWGLGCFLWALTCPEVASWDWQNAIRHCSSPSEPCSPHANCRSAQLPAPHHDTSPGWNRLALCLLLQEKVSQKDVSWGKVMSQQWCSGFGLLNRLCLSSDPLTTFIDLLFLFLIHVVTPQSLCGDNWPWARRISFLLRAGSHSVEGLRVIGLKIPWCSNYMELFGQSPLRSLSCTLDTSARITWLRRPCGLCVWRLDRHVHRHKHPV